MKYAEIKPVDIANGTGVRVSLFVSGCTHHCPGCFNEIAQDFNYGDPFTEAIENKILEMLGHSYISGLTLLGGEPFEPSNQIVLLPFLKKVKAKYPKKSIWAFSGYTFDELMGESRAHCDATESILKMIDVLVDGEFIEAKKDISLRFRGSSNQRLIDIPKTLIDGNVILWSDK